MTTSTTIPVASARQRRRTVTRGALRLLGAAGLAVDAYVHTDLAGRYVTNGALSESTLFLLQAALAAAAALGVAVRGRRPEAAFGVIVAAAALGAVLLYRYVDVGAIGPLPNMYEPVWYTEKTISAIAEAVALVSCAALFLLGAPRRMQRSRPSPLGVVDGHAGVRVPAVGQLRGHRR